MLRLHFFVFAFNGVIFGAARVLTRLTGAGILALPPLVVVWIVRRKTEREVTHGSTVRGTRYAGDVW